MAPNTSESEEVEPDVHVIKRKRETCLRMTIIAVLARLMVAELNAPRILSCDLKGQCQLFLESL